MNVSSVTTYCDLVLFYSNLCFTLCGLPIQNSEEPKKNGSLVSKEELFTKVWKTSYVGDMNTLYTHVNSLRDAIEQDPSAPRYLITVRGKGYLLNGK